MKKLLKRIGVILGWPLLYILDFLIAKTMQVDFKQEREISRIKLITIWKNL